MKKNDRDQIKTATPAELAKKAGDLRKQITEETLKRQSSNVKNVHTVKSLRHKLAVILSVKRMAEIAKER